MLLLLLYNLEQLLDCRLISADLSDLPFDTTQSWPIRKSLNMLTIHPQNYYMYIQSCGLSDIIQFNLYCFLCVGKLIVFHIEV